MFRALKTLLTTAIFQKCGSVLEVSILVSLEYIRQFFIFFKETVWSEYQKLDTETHVSHLYIKYPVTEFLKKKKEL